MRKFIFGILVLALLVAVVPVAEANQVNLRIINNTGYTWTALYVSPATSSGWGSDRASRLVHNGQDYTVRVQNGVTYDIRAVDTDGDTYTTRTTPNGNWRITIEFRHMD